MELNEAIALTIDMLLRGGAQHYGYDLYPPHVVRTFLSGSGRYRTMSANDWSGK
jgi:hypothetical protein